jgi:hypothetical protein
LFWLADCNLFFRPQDKQQFKTLCVCEIRYRMRNDLVYQLIQQGVDAWAGSHPPTKTLPFHGDIDLGRQIDVPANLQIGFNC